MAEKTLTVDNLKISFRTRNGNVQAVRNISFDLYKGETLAIVGESGSGKSQTSRAILGILANNAIVESGRIIYNGQDLLKIDEEPNCFNNRKCGTIINERNCKHKCVECGNTDSAYSSW